MSGKASPGLATYAKAVGRAERDAGRSDGAPQYGDGSRYRIGDELAAGAIRYYRPAKAHEHSEGCPGRSDASSGKCSCVDRWRFVLVDGSVVMPSTAVPFRELERRTIIDIRPGPQPDRVLVTYSCGHTANLSDVLARILRRPEAAAPICHDRGCARVAKRLG